MEQKVIDWNAQIRPADEQARRACKDAWDHISKPLDGLGELETIVTRIAALTSNIDVDISRRALAIFCADNGIVEEGVSQSDASVTAIVAAAMAREQTSVCLMAKSAKVDIYTIDMGMLTRVEGVRDMHIADGTGNIAKGPAMSREQAIKAIENGITLAKEFKEKGYKILTQGEMGIANTSTSAAVAAVMLGLPVETVTGRGAGLSDAGLDRKVAAIKKAIGVNAPDKSDGIDVLSKVGGFDIAGMAGLIIGGAIYRIPVVIDGVISMAAALIAAAVCPDCVQAMIASHSGAEPAMEAGLKKLGLTPVIYARMKLGEGTGAVCLIPIIDMALAVYGDAGKFGDSGVEQYVPQS